MNNTIELLQQLNTMQSEHIKVLEERINILNDRIDILNHTIEIDKITISTQEKTIELYIEHLNTNSNE
jgi:hypothetical protein